MSSTVPSSGEPLFSIITPCYGVARYLPDFIASIEAQDIDSSLLEVVAVDDGSVDDTLEVLLAWEARRPDLVRVVQQENGGQAAARNTGIEHARGTWLTFPDPDDFLDHDYFSRVAAMIDKHPQVDMLATNRWLYNEVTQESSNTHPLRSHFTRDAVYNLAVNDSFFQGGSVCSFFRRDRVLAEGLRYDVRLRPTFEDGHFCGAYLLTTPEPKVAFLGTRYHYRKRADGTSTLQTALAHPGRYGNVLRHGSLDLLERGVARYGHVPLWLQNLIIYEIHHYVGREDSLVGTLAPAELRDTFHELMARITALLEPEVVRAYRRTRVTNETRELIQHGWRDEDWHSQQVQVTAWDAEQKAVRVTYRWTGTRPSEQVILGERVIEPFASKDRTVVIQGRTVMHERILWVPEKRVRLRIGGRLLPVTVVPAQIEAVALRTQDLPYLARHRRPVTPQPEPTLTFKERLLARRARTKRVRERFRDAWVLQDRIHNAEDNAEHLFRYLRQHQPKTNAWFVVQAGTPCHERLRAEFGERVVAHGTDEWAMLMMNAQHLISSHADLAVTNPVALRSFRLTPRYTFLQHGVTKDDLSGWLNQRPIQTLVASTQQEYDAFTADETSYRVTTREVVLTGMPRFDALTRTNRRFPEEKRDLVLLSPTWRDYLSQPLVPGSQERHPVAHLRETTYWKSWTGLLESKELREVAEREGLRVALLPHPNLQNAFKDYALPEHVERFTFGTGLDVAELFSRSALMVTDFSSTAFDAAYIERPIVYFHCDVDPDQQTRHVGVPGYFDYARDGFGPVAHTLDATVAEIDATLSQGRVQRSPWRERTAAAFQFRDEENCARVAAEIRRSTRPRKLVTASSASSASSGAGESTSATASAHPSGS